MSTFRIARYTPNGIQQMEEVEAKVVMSGLAIHKRTDGKWDISHVQTGLNVLGWFKTLRAARAALDIMAECDWDVPQRQICDNDSSYKDARYRATEFCGS